MPEFRNIIPEEDRWSVIAFLRSFNPKYIQPAPKALATFSGRIVTLSMQYSDAMKKIVVTAREKIKENDKAPAAGIEALAKTVRAHDWDLRWISAATGDGAAIAAAGAIDYAPAPKCQGAARGFPGLDCPVAHRPGRLDTINPRQTITRADGPAAFGMVDLVGFRRMDRGRRGQKKCDHPGGPSRRFGQETRVSPSWLPPGSSHSGIDTGRGR